MTSPLNEDDQRAPSPIPSRDPNDHDRKWNRGTQIAVIASPLVALLIFVATLFKDELAPPSTADADLPTDTQPKDRGVSLLPDPTPPSTPEVESVTQLRIHPPVGTRPSTAATTERAEAPEPRTEVGSAPESGETARTETRERTVRRSFENPHCADPTNIRWNVRAADGWRIDVASVALVSSTSSKSAYYGVSDLSEDGFAINGRVSNDGECVTVLDKQVARDVRGNLTVSGTYNEVRQVFDSS